MEFLVIEESPAVRDKLCYILLSLGIKGVPLSTRQQALDLLRRGERFDGAIIDVDSSEVDGFRLIQELKEGEGTQSIRIIVHTIQSQKEFVLRMVEMGILGYLLKPFDEKDASAKLKKILEKTVTSHNEARKHVRVRPDPEELLRVHFKVSNYPNMVGGKVVDISLGGVAIEMFTLLPEGILTAGRIVPKIQFTLTGHTFTPSGQIVLARAKFLALRFIGMKQADKIALARYISKRISA